MAIILPTIRDQIYAQEMQDLANSAAAQATELYWLAELATAEANRLAQELEKSLEELEIKRLALEESRRITVLHFHATQEVCGTRSGTSNIQAMFRESASVLDRFLASNPLLGAIVSLNVNLDAVKLLVEKGQRYDEWEDLVDEGTSLHLFLSEKFKISTIKLNLG